MFMIHNTAEIKARGGAVFDDDDFEIVACASCGCQYLYNSEVLQLYYDPNDLQKVYLYIDGADIPPCRECGTQNWTYDELSADDEAIVKSGPWSWALTK